MKAKIPTRALFAVSLLFVTPMSAPAGEGGCPPPGETRNRTAEELMEHRLAAFRTADLDAMMCDYADDATLTVPGDTRRGKAAVREFFAPGFSSRCFDGDQVTVKSLTPVDDRYLLFVFSVNSVNCDIVIEDGVETFILDKGLISGQTIYTP